MNEEFIRINITFKPPIKIAEQVAKLSEEISKKEDVYFVIDNLHFYPHITIYSPEYPKRKEDEVLETIEKLVKNFSPIKFVPKEIETSQGYFGIAAQYSDEIKKIHEAIVEKLNPLREGHLREKYLNAYNMKFSEEKMQNIQKYGYADSMSLYNPHITITRLKDDGVAEKVAKEIAVPFGEFAIDKIGVFRMGENGTCIELIKEFNLK
jgi:2'-5' RNA ligase